MINPSAIVFDVDGTLISDKKVILSETKAAISELYWKFGVKFFLASARSPRSLKSIVSDLSIDCGLICFNGALSFENQDSSVSQAVTCDYVNQQTCEQILKAIRSLDITISIFTSDLWIANRRDYWLEREIVGTANEPDKITGDLLADPEVLRVAHKILLRGNSEAIESARSKISNAASGTYNSFSDRSTAMEISPGPSSKYTALRSVLVRIKVPMESVLVFGDADNDLEMIMNFHNSVAMSNGSDTLKRSARFIIGNNNEPSIAEFLRNETQLSSGATIDE